MKHIHLLCVATETIYTEVMLAFRKYFVNRGCHFTSEVAFKKEPKKPFSKDVNIVIKAQRKFIPELLPKESKKVLFQSEQFSKLREFNSMPHQENWDLILDVFESNVQRVGKDSKAEVRFFPIGEHPAYRLFSGSPFMIEEEHCDLDCYFFGARTKGRVEYWNKYIKPIAPNSRFGNMDYNTDKYENIKHAKINLFIPGWEPYYIPTMHIMQVLANRKFLIVVSDTLQNFIPYQPGLHFVLTSKKDSKEVIKKYLNNPNARLSFAAKMYDNLTLHHGFDTYLSNAIAGII